MKEKKLVTQSLPEALRCMAIGETCIAPDNSSPSYVKKACSILKRDGYHFSTSTCNGIQKITRLQ